MRRLESSIELAACARVRTQFNVESVKLNLKGNRGFPDRLFWTPVTPALVEFKRSGGQLEPLQAFRHEQLRKWGYPVETHDTVEGVVALIKRRLAVLGLERLPGMTPEELTARRLIMRKFLNEL